jgi:hypothetical protein
MGAAKKGKKQSKEMINTKNGMQFLFSQTQLFDFSDLVPL